METFYFGNGKIPLELLQSLTHSAYDSAMATSSDFFHDATIHFSSKVFLNANEKQSFSSLPCNSIAKRYGFHRIEVLTIMN